MFVHRQIALQHMVAPPHSPQGGGECNLPLWDDLFSLSCVKHISLQTPVQSVFRKCCQRAILLVQTIEIIQFAAEDAPHHQQFSLLLPAVGGLAPVSLLLILARPGTRAGSPGQYPHPLHQANLSPHASSDKLA